MSEMHKYLIYHIYADGDQDMLAFHLAHLKMYWNGWERRIIKITYDDPAKVSLLRPYLDIENPETKTSYEIYSNNPGEGESVGLLEALDSVRNYREDQEFREDENIGYKKPCKAALMIASTNGVSKSGDQEREKVNIRAWSRALYHTTLSNTALLELKKAFKEGKKCFGSFKRDVPSEKGGPRPCPWHYSGLFYWLDVDTLFSRNWKPVEGTRHAIEMYPGYIFDSSEAVDYFNLIGPTDYVDTYHNRIMTEHWIEKV